VCVRGTVSRVVVADVLWTQAMEFLITILENIHRSVFYLEHNVSKTRLCLRPQVKRIPDIETVTSATTTRETIPRTHTAMSHGIHFFFCKCS
jgi:hypothetical protein